jgi:hypothetical protein
MLKKNHSGIIVVDDYILEKPHIKQKYMGSEVPFHPCFIPTLPTKTLYPFH